MEANTGSVNAFISQQNEEASRSFFDTSSALTRHASLMNGLLEGRRRLAATAAIHSAQHCAVLSAGHGGHTHASAVCFTSAAPHTAPKQELEGALAPPLFLGSHRRIP